LEVHQEYSHASKLGILVKDVVKLADIRLDKINALALSSGPGSYTGLRIGTSLAKGISYALDIPMISVPTLQIMATSVSHLYPEDVSFCPMIDARRMEVYCQLFNHDLVEIEPVQAREIDSRSFEEYLDNGPVVFFGSGAAKCKSVIVHPNARFLKNVNPLASQMGDFGYSKFRQGQFEDIIQFVPLYLKEFFIRKPVDA
jgi:tRNA threonylcarbamoyladenosine biosynthesis protein TsaB